MRPKIGSVTRRDPSGESLRKAVTELIELACQTLASYQVLSGLYCFERKVDPVTLQGASPQGSLQILIGLQRAHAAGYMTQVDLDELFELCLSWRDSFTIGDLGLALWADSRADGRASRLLAHRLRAVLSEDRLLSNAIGMDIAWLATGLGYEVARGFVDERVLPPVLSEIARRQARSGLFRHFGDNRLRSRFPNFATEIYSILALAVAAGAGFSQYLQHAVDAADRLLQLQQDDGAWPWLFDANRGAVVERYELYTVHQDSMAPMALLMLTDLTGDTEYRKAAIHGLWWARGNNELHADLLDLQNQLVYRSIRRRRALRGRTALAANAVASLALGRPLFTRTRRPEINRDVDPVLVVGSGRSGL